MADNDTRCYGEADPLARGLAALVGVGLAVHAAAAEAIILNSTRNKTDRDNLQLPFQ